jgi:hypothetical protein
MTTPESALTTEDRRQLVRMLDPGLPLDPDSALYVPRDAGGDYLSRTTRTLFETLDAADPAQGSTQLFTGFPGTGKTTELRRLDTFLKEQANTEVLFIDGERYVDLFSPLDIIDVLRVLAYCIDGRARQLEGKPAEGKDSYWERFSHFFAQTEIDFKSLKVQDGMLELKANPTFRKQVRDALKARFQVFVQQAHEAIGSAIARIRKVSEKERVVVIFDSLEKIRAADGEQASELEASLERVFLQHADLLRLPTCHTIYTFPLGLRFLVTGLGTRYSSDPLVMPMVSVTHEDPGTDGEPAGVEFLHRMMLRRLDRKDEAVFGPTSGKIIRQLATASGGYPRDFIRLVRNLVQHHRVFPVGAEAVEQVIADLAEEYSRVYRDTYAPVLKVVATTHRLPRTDEAQMRLLARLVQNLLVLAYRNGHEWYDIHPLLRRDPQILRQLGS